MSNKIKRFHGIPTHQSCKDLSLQEIQRLKGEYRNALPRLHEEACIEGFAIEERFMEAWSNPVDYPDWIVAVRKGTKQEDLCEKTDAVITTQDHIEIRIQIKRKKHIQPELIVKHHKKGIAMVSIQLADRLRAIRHKTIEAIKRLEKWQGQQI